MLDIVVDCRLQFFGGAVDAAAELAFGQQGKPAFHQVQPAGRSGREMHVEAGAFYQPVLDRLRLMSSIVVQDHVDVQLLGHVLLDGVEEVAKLDRAMALLILANDLAGLGIQRGKQTGGAVARIVMRAPLDLAGTHGQQRGRAIQRLNLALFVHTQDQRALRWIQI